MSTRPHPSCSSPRSLLTTLFPTLVATTSKSLRALLLQKMLSDLRASNAKTTNHRLNRTVQKALFHLLTSDRASPKGIWAVRITRELWRRQVWTDARAVEIMKEACLAEHDRVVVAGVRFFLGGDKEREEALDASSDDEPVDMGKLRYQAGLQKKTRKKERVLKKAAASVKKQERKKLQPHPLNFSALHLLHDPQGFAETLFSRHVQSTKSPLRLEQKLLALQLVSRLVGLHQLTVLPLYSYFLKYLTPRQTSVTTFLACLAQATHALVPPDVLEPLVQKIANEFVSEASASEVAASGLNAIRELCARQPLAMRDTLLQDLVLYRKSKDKGVMMAAKGLLSLYREHGAELLPPRERGKAAAMRLRSGERKERRFGEEPAGEIEGIELLEQWKADAPSDGADDEDWKQWEVDEDDSDGSGGWIDVQSDADIAISDSDDEPPAKKARLSEPDTGAPTGVGPAASRLATTRVLTPADLAKLHELRVARAVAQAMPSARRRPAERHADDALTAAEIEAPGQLGVKKTKEEKVAMAKADRGTHQSATARRKEKKRADGKSTTNADKARRKNIFMTMGKAKQKQKRSLVDVGRTLRGHVERQKRGGRRGNRS